MPQVFYEMSWCRDFSSQCYWTGKFSRKRRSEVLHFPCFPCCVRTVAVQKSRQCLRSICKTNAIYIYLYIYIYWYTATSINVASTSLQPHTSLLFDPGIEFDHAAHRILTGTCWNGFWVLSTLVLFLRTSMGKQYCTDYILIVWLYIHMISIIINLSFVFIIVSIITAVVVVLLLLKYALSPFLPTLICFRV